MEELETFLENHRRIKEINEKLLELAYRVRSPKSQRVTDMPRCTSASGNPLEMYIIQQERLQNEKQLLESELDEMWRSLKAKMKACGISQEWMHLMHLRYRKGYPWKKCTAIMKHNHGTSWNENKTFRVYRAIVKSIQEYNVKIG